MWRLVDLNKINNTYGFYALSTDPFPRDVVRIRNMNYPTEFIFDEYALTNGSSVFCEDTQLLYMYDEKRRIWYEQ